MRRIVAMVGILIAFSLPVQAGLITDAAPLEKELLEKQRIQENLVKSPPQTPEVEASSGSWYTKWYWWALAAVAVGAAAAGGGGGGSSSSAAPSTSTGDVSVTW